jgi:hypothetical protein
MDAKSEETFLIKPGEDAAPGLHLQTIMALVMVLEALVNKLKDIRKVDGRSRHTMAAGHLRSALTYEQEVLGELMDPSGFMACTHKALYASWRATKLTQAFAQLTDGENADPIPGGR